MNLFQFVAERRPTEKLFISANGELNTGQAVDLERRFGGLLSPLSGKSVALRFRSQLRLAEAILLLDGICRQIVLLPQDLSSEAVESFMDLVGAEVVLTDVFDDSSWPKAIQFVECAGSPPERTYITDWHLPTSGTTGVPKLIKHSMETLSRTVKRDSTKGKAIIWGLLYEPCRFAGLQVYLQAILGGSALVVPENADMPLSQQLELFITRKINALSATPSMWRKILMTDQVRHLSLDLITLGGEIADQGVLDALAKEFPRARITHVYASTEFGVGFSVSDRREGFSADWLQAEDFPFRIDAVSSELMYLDQSHGQLSGTGDCVAVEDDRVRFLGRLNGSINVGGNKVMPEEVEGVLLRHPAVVQASVSGRRNPIMGQLVEASIVLVAGNSSFAEMKMSIMQHCRANLAPFKVPALINFVDSLELSANGKIVRS